tara:strand:+ start:174 stop:770 length:597 start_codon:yes stop_codon:yes gene_type:complete
MSEMFSNAPVFNQDISGWDTSNVTDMNSMFGATTTSHSPFYVAPGGTQFNHDLSGWCVSKIDSTDVFMFVAPSTSSNHPVWGTCPDYTIKVTASSNEDYTLSGTDRNGTVSGNDPSLTFNVGDEINFIVNAPNHPLYIKTLQNTGTDFGASGVTNNGQADGVVNWKPIYEEDINHYAGTYSYQCSAHNGMFGTITVNE